jgi:ATP-dependent DNA helicase RecG
LTLNGTWEGNLFQFDNRVMPLVASTLKTPFQLGADLYRYDESSVAAALREAVVNALIHADYMGQGGVVVDRWADRIELSNPGTLLLSHEQLLRGGVSECRNKSLQLMFQMMGAGDKAGSGLDKIRSSWADTRFRDPRLRETQRPDRVSLSLPMISILPEDSLEQLGLRFGASLDRLRPEEVQILVMALEEGAITNLRLQEVLTIHRTDLTRILQQLVRDGFLGRRGFGRGTRYELSEGGGDRMTDAKGSTGTSTDTFTDTSASTDSGRPDTGVAVDTRPFAERDPDGWAALRRDTEAVRNRTRMTSAELQRAARQIAMRAGWLTRTELASLLGRNSENIRDSVIQPLIAGGVLRMRFPSRNHPAQAHALAEWHAEAPETAGD